MRDKRPGRDLGYVTQLAAQQPDQGAPEVPSPRLSVTEIEFSTKSSRTQAAS